MSLWQKLALLCALQLLARAMTLMDRHRAESAFSKTVYSPIYALLLSEKVSAGVRNAAARVPPHIVFL